MKVWAVVGVGEQLPRIEVEEHPPRRHAVFENPNGCTADRDPFSYMPAQGLPERIAGMRAVPGQSKAKNTGEQFIQKTNLIWCCTAARYGTWFPFHYGTILAEWEELQED